MGGTAERVQVDSLECRVPARRLPMLRVPLYGMTLTLLTAGVVHADPPEPPVIPLDARGFTAGLALQEAYVRKLQRDADAKAHPERAAKAAADARAKAAEAAAPKSKT